MIFIPFRFDIALYRLPIVTVLVCIVCLLVYAGQFFNDRVYETNTRRFCSNIGSTVERMMLRKVLHTTEREACEELVVSISLAVNQAATIDEFVANSQPFAGYSEQDSKDYTRLLIQRMYDDYRAAVPPLRTKELWYHPHTWDPWTMLTASFAHASWGHVIGNLLFFFAFAAAVEMFVGHLIFLAIILAMAFGTGVTYSMAMINIADAKPTVGLSGIVMGMMALFTYFLPSGTIRCFYWFLIKVGTVSIPAWMLTLWFVGFDTYQLFAQEDQSGINLIYHVSGAAIGFAIGLVFLRELRRDLPARIV